MWFRIFIFLTTATVYVCVNEEPKSQCLLQISNCTQTYSSRIGDHTKILYNYYTCVLAINVCTKVEQQLYQQPILTTVLDTMRQMAAEEESQKRFESGGADRSTCGIWIVIYGVVSMLGVLFDS